MSDIEEYARAVEARLGLAEEDAAYQPLRAEPAPGRPNLQIDDLSAIPFLQDVVGVELYQLRARVRAQDRDAFVATCPEMPDYEEYNRERLGLGRARFVHAPAVGPAIEVARACLEDGPLGELTAICDDAGGLNVHPYMGSAPVWELASALSRRAIAPVTVLGPTPALTRFCNDKVEVSRAVEALLSPRNLVDTRVASTPEGLATALAELAGRHPRVALKMARCASAMGNRVFTAEAVARMTEAERLSAVRTFLQDKEWDPGDEVLAVSWEATDSSPSTQLWIPRQGDPRVDGVYEQLLMGPEQVFLGSVPSRLGAELDGELTRVSLVVARLYQALGYVGRCSFDFIVVAGEVKFVECNGRWGGTSTPMHLLDRLFPTGRPAYRARDYHSDALVGVSFGELAARVGDDLYDPRTGQGRFVIYNVGCLPAYGKFDVIALGRTVDEASDALENDLAPRLG